MWSYANMSSLMFKKNFDAAESDLSNGWQTHLECGTVRGCCHTDLSLQCLYVPQWCMHTVTDVSDIQTTTTTVLRPFVRDHLGEPVSEGWAILDFTKAETMGWQCHQLDHMQVICTLLQTDNHARTASLSFLWVGCFSCHSTNSVKALKAN